MNAFYNKAGVGDVLLVQLTPETPSEIRTETNGDVTVIRDAESGKAAGFNLFHASSYMEAGQDGRVEVDEALLDGLQRAFEQNGARFDFEIDLSPKFVVGHVLSKEKHPNADKLNICQVDVGGETLQIVCGAPNVEAGQSVVVAKPGAVMPSGMVIKDAELRGVPSSGMICSARELDLPDAPQEKGILVLEGDRKPGESFAL
ncbi:YtpR family tRNA-binding protein [Bhargavaea ullalensis]|uniref:tRNA-binding protein n=1 Tax=Bhargavaea ullalensis TaxID=1265685 RepID=A0ABV2GAS7_9BACL